MNRRLVNERDAGEYLGGIPVKTMRNWRSRGEGPSFVKLGALVRYDVADLDAYVERHRRRTEAA